MAKMMPFVRGENVGSKLGDTWKIVSVVALAMAVGACAKSGPAPISAGDRYAANASFDESYPLGAGDKIHVTVFSEPQLGGDFSVSGDGVIALPLIGNITAAGKTTTETARTVQEMLANGYLKNPRVSVEVINYRPFFILGEVKAPGQYPYVNGLTVTNAIATAQGYTPRSRRKYVLIRRFGEQVEQEYILSPNLRVLPGDTIRLAERYF